MAVVKLTASKKAIQFITDEGDCYQTSALWLMNLLTGEAKHGIILLSKLPYKVSADRFKKSPVWGDIPAEEGNVVIKEDALDPKTRTERQEAKGFTDKKVW